MKLTLRQLALKITAGKQLPPSLSTSTKKTAKNLNYDNDGDAEMSDDEIKGQKHTSKKRKHHQRDALPSTYIDYDGGNLEGS